MKKISYFIFLLLIFMSFGKVAFARQCDTSKYEYKCEYRGLARDTKKTKETNYVLRIAVAKNKDDLPYCIDYVMNGKEKSYYYRKISNAILDYNWNTFYARFSDSAISNLNSKGSCPDLAYIETHYANSWCFENNSDKGFCTKADKYYTQVPSKTKDSYNPSSTEEKPGNTVIEEEKFVFCARKGVLISLQILGYVIYVLKILIPLLLIVFGSVDFAKAVIASDDKAIKTSASTLAKRTIAGIVVFFIPTIINFVFSLIQTWTSIEDEFNNCKTCIFTPEKCDNIIQNTKDL